MALIAGTLDPIWQHLTPSHPRYPMFRWTLMYQEDWTSGVHLTYWQTHLKEWPLISAKPSQVGLMARHAALWLRDGYSKAQVARALGYKPGNAPKALWRRASDYLDWLRQQPVGRPGDLGGVQALEDMYAAGVDPALRENTFGAILCDPPVVDPSSPNAAEDARRWVRRTFRTPRVVTVAEWERSPFGWPESISTRLLYGEVELEAIERAKQELQGQKPYHADLLAA